MVFIFNAFREIFQASFGKALKAPGLREKCSAQATFNAAFTDSACEACDRRSAASDANVRVFAMREDAVRYDPTRIGLRQVNEFSLARWFFVEDRSEFRVAYDFLKDSEFGAVEISPALVLRHRRNV